MIHINIFTSDYQFMSNKIPFYFIFYNFYKKDPVKSHFILYYNVYMRI